MAFGRKNRNEGRRGVARRCGTALATFALLAIALAQPAAADPIEAKLTASVAGGYARLVFSAGEYIDGTARIAGSVLIISFKKPVHVTVDRVSEQAPGYVAAARLDPDGSGVRMALDQPVTVHTLTAGEKFFVDLLPSKWSGVPPSLPEEVVDELARRARAAEEQVRHDHRFAAEKKLPPIHVHVAAQPTFTRYVFDLPNDAGVAIERARGRLVLNFDTPFTFDLGDAQAALPAAVQELSSELEPDSSSVRFLLAAVVDVRSFRDEHGYVVDVVNPNNAEQAVPAPAAAPPPTAPAKPSEAGQAQPPPGPAKPLHEGEAVVAPPSLADAAAQISAAAAAPKAETPAPAASPVSPSASPSAAPSPPAPLSAPPSSSPAPQASAAPAPAPPAKPATPQATAPASSPAPAPQANAAPEKAPASASPPPSPAAASAPPAAAVKPDEKPAAAKSSEAPAAKPAPRADGKIAVDMSRQGAMLKLAFNFSKAVPAAVFQRADTLWIVFDADTDLDLSALDGESTRTVKAYRFAHVDGADVIRLKLDRPHLASVAADGPAWIVEIGDSVLEPRHALDITRNLIGPNRSSISVPFEAPQKLHKLDDPEVGDTLYVVTALPPARGFIDPHNFIEFDALASTLGVVIEPIADDIKVDLAPDKVIVSRPNGLTLSTSLLTLLHGSSLRPVMFDSQLWGFDQKSPYFDRQSELLAAAAAAPQNKRIGPRVDLARFYVARGMYPEAKGVLDVALGDDHNAGEAVSALVLRAIAEVMMSRPEAALKDLSEPSIGDQHDAALWRALAFAKEGRWTQARATFKTADAAVATLPVELQRVALKDEMRSSIEVGDFDGASGDLNDFETIGVPHDMQPVIAVLMGRLAEGMGRNDDALTAYRTAADSWDRPAAAQGLLRETALRYRLHDLKRDEVISQLESLTTLWRGDETEIEALKILAHLYTEDGRYRDAFYVMRSAMAARPDSTLTRQIQDEAAQTFDSLFLAGKGDAMPAIDALALFYDFRELTPVGSRGDEMIRRLADRLVAVDLLDQAASLLQYQVDHRLQGAARAQVGNRLAVIYLMDRKPDRALAVLRATRTADLSNELRTQRLLLEARALSDLGRHELALDVVSAIPGREAIRLRSDILWAARKWGKAAEQIELMYGDRYKDFQPLSEIERADILRAEVGYALAEDTLGLGRLRDKYAAKMAATPDARAFEIVSAPLGNSGAEFGAIAHAAASIDTLDNFLRDMKARFPDSNPISPTADASPQPGQAVPPKEGAAKTPPAAPPAPGPSAEAPSAQAPNTEAPNAAAPNTAAPGADNAPPPAEPPDTVPAMPVFPGMPPARASGHSASL